MFKNLFKRNTIRVQMIEANSNESFGIVRLKPDQLPASFDKPTTMHIENEEWQVEKAEPMHSREFIVSGELILWLRKIISIDPQNLRYSIPTISDELPGLSANALFNDFTHTINEDDWRQIEFLPVSELSTVQEEMKMIEEVLFPENDRDFDSTVSGYDKIHVRNKIKRHLISIPLDDFEENFPILKKGKLAIYGQAGFVENGFVFNTSNYTYYGTIENGTIKELCIDFFESIDEEINSILLKYQLVFVSWRRGEIVTA